jgi:hypothetical protein
MDRLAYYKAKITHAKARIDKLKRKRNNKTQSQDQKEGALITGGSLAPVQSGIPTTGTLN